VRVVIASTRSFEPCHASRNPSPLPQLPQSIPPRKKQYRHVNGFDPDLGDACCDRNLLAAQRDFCEQKGSLQEALEAGNQEFTFYPKFHCEVNFVEHFWCEAKWYARQHCEYTLDGLREGVPAALYSIMSASVNRYFKRCMRVLDAYADGLSYGTEAFKNRVYKSHRKVVDKSNGKSLVCPTF
jgi:hypothetical protein